MELGRVEDLHAELRGRVVELQFDVLVIVDGAVVVALVVLLFDDEILFGTTLTVHGQLFGEPMLVLRHGQGMGNDRAQLTMVDDVPARQL